MTKKYRRYKNSLEMYLSSKKGRRVLNFAYSWGAAIVILGALFKLLHLPFGNEMLFIGMITEFFVFFISGFEQPEEHYKWEQVFPELDSTNPMDRKEMEARRQYLLRKAQEASAAAADAPVPAPSIPAAHHDMPVPASGSDIPYMQGAGGDVQRLSAAIDQLSVAAEQLGRLGTLSAEMTQQWSQLHESGRAFEHSTDEYKAQMETLSSHMRQLNGIYETQLAGITDQVAAIDQINHGLEHIKNMYQDSAIDSTTFRSQNERLVGQLTELNRVYARILDALTVNMGTPGMAGRPYRYDPGYTTHPDYYSSQARREQAYPGEEYHAPGRTQG